MSHAEIGNIAFDTALANGAFAADRPLVLDGLIENGLHWEGRPICSVLRPLLVDEQANAQRERAAALVSRAIGIAAERAAQSPELRARLGLTRDEEELLRVRSGPDGEFLGRLDGFVAPDGSVKFIEHNPFPSGFAFADALADRFEATAAFRACASRVSVGRKRLLTLFLEKLLDGTRATSRGGPVRLGIVMPTGGPASLEQVPETQIILRALAAAGVEVRISGIAGVASAGGRITVEDTPLDAIAVTAWNELLAPEHRNSPLWDTRDHEILVLDPIASSSLRGTKALFCLLTDPELDTLFPSDVRDALRTHVPWTRSVAEGRTTIGSDTIDLVAFVRANRERLVLKPANEYGAIGVKLGWDCSEGEWDDAIERALASHYVVQERVIGAVAPFPVAGEHGLEQRRFFVDWNPFVWGGRHVHGALSRLCEQSIMNIQAGASSLVPVYTAAGMAA